MNGPGSHRFKRPLRSAWPGTLVLFALPMILFACGSGLDKPGSRGGNVTQTAPAASNELVNLIRSELAAKNRLIDSVAVLDLRAVYPGGKYILIGWGIPRGGRFEGRLGDELFGVFELDPRMSRISRTYDIIPSEAWLDHIWHIAEIRRDSIVVVRTGLTYADEPQQRKSYARQAPASKGEQGAR